MKELSIEQKAKRYDEVIERAKEYYNVDLDNTLPVYAKGTMEYLFPELAEFEDDEIRKSILELVRQSSEILEKKNQEQMIAWLEKQGEKFQYWKPSEEQLEALDYAYNSCPDTERGNYYEGILGTIIDDLHKLSEKQGEQKPADKVELKFHEGDFILNGDVTDDGKPEIFRVLKVCDTWYDVENIYDSRHTIITFKQEYSCRVWNIIQDAKNGDVLACENGWTCIFKTLVNDENFGSYCFMDNTKWFCETGSECHTLKEEFVKAYNGKIYPATKEQRDTFEKVMADAGWEFDFDKKELRKIEQKPAWSEEDNNCLSTIIAEFSKCAGKSVSKDEWMRCNDFLNSLRDRVWSQTKQEWSEEEIEKAAQEWDSKASFTPFYMTLDDNGSPNGVRQDITTHKESFKAGINWILKSMKERCTWKPSEEQIAILDMVLTNESMDDNIARILRELREQLKKLRG